MSGAESWREVVTGKFGSLEISGTAETLSKVSWTPLPFTRTTVSCPQVLPLWAQSLQKRLSEHVNGEKVHVYGDIPLDWNAVSSFSRLVLEACSRIPTGRTRTYGALAKELGAVGAARAVGQVMKRNPFPVVIPCHRVVGSTPNSRFHYTGGGPEMKRTLMFHEGIEFPVAQSSFMF